MSSEHQRYNHPNPNGQRDPYRRNMSNPNMNNSYMDNQNMNNSNMNKPNMNNSQPNKGRRPADFSMWGKSPTLQILNRQLNTNNNNFYNESNFNENKSKMQAHPPEPTSPPNRNIPQQNNYYQQERFNDNQSNFHQHNRSNNYNGQDNRYDTSYNRRSEYGNMPSNYNRGDYPNDYDRHKNNRGDYPNDYDNHRRHNYDDYDRFNNYDRRDWNRHRNDYDRDSNRYNDKYDRNGRGDRDDNFHSIRRHQSSSTTLPTNSASISSSSSSSSSIFKKANSLPKAKLNNPEITPKSPQISLSPQSFLPDSDVDIESDDNPISPINKDDKNRKSSSNIDSSIMISRQEVVDQPNNIAELPDSIKKLTQGEKPNSPSTNPAPSKDFTFTKPKKKVALISPSNSSISTHDLFNDTDSKPKSHVEGLTPINKKPAINYSQQFGNGISPFPGIKKGKDSFYDSFEANENVDEWIEMKLFGNSKNNQNNDDSDKLSQNFDELDFIEFIHEFNFDDDILRRRDWQKNPESLIRRISSKEFDFDKNNEPIEAFIVKDGDDPFYYDLNIFTLEPVSTEEERLSKLLVKYNLPDIHQYIGDQVKKIDEENKKSTNSLNKLKDK